MIVLLAVVTLLLVGWLLYRLTRRRRTEALEAGVLAILVEADTKQATVALADAQAQLQKVSGR